MSGDVPKLELQGLAKRYGNVGAVAGVDLAIKSGESIVLLGPSGCGKTTTLRLVAGFLKPDDGRIIFDGKVIADRQSSLPPERRQLGMVFQNYAVWPHKTVFENVAYGLVVARVGKADIARRVNRALDLVKLAGMGERYPGELSGGQQQRVALARAIVTEPKILLLDEPLSNLDARLREEMRFELKELHARTGMTTIYVTHDQDEALVLADRIVVMNRGVIEQIGAPQSIYLRPTTRFVADFIGNTNLIDGAVEDIDGDRVQLASDLGMALWCRAEPEHAARLSRGDRATMSIRPEAVRIGAQDGGTEATVVKSAFLGNRYELWLKIRDREIRAQTAGTEDISTGRVSVSFDADLARLVR
jgi:ABC-type Fe3+/spermidine/putrescine transport system ATPase subunit